MKKTYPKRPQIKGRSFIYPERDGTCHWCGMDLKLTKDHRRISFCCHEHSILYQNNFEWQNGIMYSIIERDGSKCVKCGFDPKIFNKKLKELFPFEKYKLMDWKNRDKMTKKQNDYVKSLGYSSNHALIEVDHIKAIKMGGDPFNYDNLQTLCYKCHKIKTKEDMGKMAKMNAICKEIREIQVKQKRESRLLEFF